MKRAHWMYSCLAVAVIAASAQGATFFVDAGAGGDSNAGTAAAKPFLTIQKAINEAALRPGPDMIQIAEGQYSENLLIKDTDPVTLSGGSGVEIVAANSTVEAIKISGGDVSISDLGISNGKKGISAGGSAQYPVSLTLRNVVVHDNKGDGVNAVNLVDITVSRCTFRANRGTAVKVQIAEDLTISNSTLEGNTGRGVRAEDVGSVVIAHCQILNNNDDGVKAVTVGIDPTRASFTVNDTTISGSADDGIDLELVGDIRLTNVTVQDTVGDDGMSVDDSVSVSIVDSVFANSAFDGIDIDDVESVSIVSTESVGNGVGGLQIKAEEHYNVQSVRVIGSDFLDNGADGVWITEEGTVVEQASLCSVTATGNGGSGLNIDITGTLKLSAITSENNGAGDVLP